MVILGPKHVPDEEPEPILKGKSEIFALRWIRDRTQKRIFGAKNLQFVGNFNLRQIKDATQNFSPANKIGQGGFGLVYKGILADKTAIAVKKLSTMSGQGFSEFLNEVRTISTMAHPNLVKLLGSCAENYDYILVYEYMENGSLKSALFGDLEGRNLKDRLDWPSRYKLWELKGRKCFCVLYGKWLFSVSVHLCRR